MLYALTIFPVNIVSKQNASDTLLSIYLLGCQFVCLSISPSVYPSVCLSFVHQQHIQKCAKIFLFQTGKKQQQLTDPCKNPYLNIIM